nr:hypothetical protein [Tanacetum cinerariifolium]
LMDKAFESQVGRNIEVYVDDLVVKSHIEAEMVRDIEETFRTLRKVNMKLNPKECSFGLVEGVFLGKIFAAVSDLKKCIKKSDFRWTAEAEQAFQQLKQHLSELPLLVAAKPQEELIMYLSATYEAVSAVLMTERRTTQTPIYFISRALQGPELNYSPMEKLVLSLVFASKRLRRGFKTFSICQVSRSKNKKADALSKIASTSFAHLSKQVLVEVLETKSITAKEVTAVIEEEGPTWMTELMNYLKEGTLPEDEKKARKLRLKARQYELMEGIIYKRSFLTPWLRCVGPLQAEYVMREIHEGSCSMHAGPRPLSGRAGEGQVPDSRNGLLHEVDRSKNSGNGYRLTNNGKQFADNPFKDWCDKLKITQHFASVKHPQSNGLVERANKSLGEGIKARLGEGNKNWVEELPHVLWAHRTMIKSSHGDTPFSLTYGTEAVIPAEIGMPTYRTIVVDVVNNDEELRLNLDLLEERRELAAMSEASHAVAGGKLEPKWEGPYEVTDALENGAYKLRSMDGTMLPRTWNVANLKQCYRSVQAAVYGLDGAPENVERHKSQAMLPLN